MEDLKIENSSKFTNVMRMEPAVFTELLECLHPAIIKHDMNYRKAIEPGLRLTLTLRYLATRESYHSLRFGFRVPHNTYALIVRQVCKAIVDEFAEESIKFPSTPQE